MTTNKTINQKEKMPALLKVMLVTMMAMSIMLVGEEFGRSSAYANSGLHDSAETVYVEIEEPKVPLAYTADGSPLIGDAEAEASVQPDGYATDVEGGVRLP